MDYDFSLFFFFFNIGWQRLMSMSHAQRLGKTNKSLFLSPR